MKHFADKTQEFTGADHRMAEGAGAAGGLGFAFLSYLPNAELRSGIDIVLDAIQLEQEVKDADIVITGEGRLDFQTAMGKVPVGVARLAKNTAQRCWHLPEVSRRARESATLRGSARFSPSSGA